MAATGLKLNFLENGEVDIDLNNTVEGFNLIVQNAIVNLTTEYGSDVLFQDKGTTLAASATKGKVVDDIAIAHECNFAALQTTKFMVESEPDNLEEENKLQTMTVSPAEVVNGVLKVNTKFESLGGERLDSSIGIEVI